jgi:hypothetical protein
MLEHRPTSLVAGPGVLGLASRPSGIAVSAPLTTMFSGLYGLFPDAVVIVDLSRALLCLDSNSRGVHLPF